ncbi:thermostable hemolysin [Amycolatopsis sp. NPDC004747]
MGTLRPGAAPEACVVWPADPYYLFCAETAKAKYLGTYGAVVDPRPDFFIAARDAERPSAAPLGVAGITSAGGRALLSERYLESPVETACAVLGEGTPERERVCELGPVVSNSPGCGLFLLRAVPEIAGLLGFDYLVATLTDRLYGVARRAGWRFTTLANACRSDLPGADRDRWGTYYSTRPRTGILRCTPHSAGKTGAVKASVVKGAA